MNFIKMMTGDLMEILIDTILDTYLIIPILFIMYLFLEYFEHKNNNKFINVGLLKYGPIFGAILGLIPQCGFGIMASLLYLERKITLGTLISVFIATSDEAIPILLSHTNAYKSLCLILFIKFIWAIIIGYIVDRYIPSQNLTYQQSNNVNHHHELLLTSLLRTLKIYLFIFVTNLSLNTAIAYIGQERLSTMLFNQSFLQPILCAFFGFIPNCASSVILSELYINNILSFSSLLAGLITNAGLGIFVFIQNKVSYKIILKICLILLISALAISIPMQYLSLL
jgi:Protein of unknown function (DUF2899).